MVLDNYWKLVAGHTTVNPTMDGKQTNIYVYNTLGNRFNVYNYLQQASEFSFFNYLYKPHVMIGDGNSEPQHDDYCLQNRITDMTNFTDQVNITNDDNRLYIVLTANGVNYTGVTKTINEIGIYKSFLYSTTIGNYYDVLYVRELLENPIVVLPGQGFSLSLEWVQA